MLSGYVGLRVLRDVEGVRAYGVRMTNDKATAGKRSFPREPLGEGFPDAAMALEEFCSRPLPRFRMHSGDQAGEWVQTSIVAPEPGNVGVATVIFGEKYGVPAIPTQVEQLVALPTEVLVMDVVVQRGMHRGLPTRETFLGNDQRTDRVPRTAFGSRTTIGSSSTGLARTWPRRPTCHGTRKWPLRSPSGSAWIFATSISGASGWNIRVPEHLPRELACNTAAAEPTK